jgi:hypothetical protein
MIIYDCFEGDDLGIARVQHDLYFGKEIPSDYGIAGTFYTLGWWWDVLLSRARKRHRSISWLGRNLGRLERVGNFSHKLLQLPHEHLAAYYRWTQTRGARQDLLEDPDARRLVLLDNWRTWIGRELRVLLEDDEVLVTNAKLILYRQFDASDRAGEALDVMLIERYGFDCVARTWRARDPVMLAAAERWRQRSHELGGGKTKP